MRPFALLLAVCLFCFALEDSGLQLGEDVSSLFVVGAKGNPVPVQKITADRPMLVVLFAPGALGDACRAAYALEHIELYDAPRRSVFVLGDFSPHNGCSGLETVAFYHSRSLKPSSPNPAASLSAIVIDEMQYVRWRLSFPNSDDGWKNVAAGVNTWFQGRQSFGANCGHCHGLDGAQASSPDVKPLVGITKKYPEAKVLELGSQFGGVDMTGWSRAKRETLLTYIRGL